MDAEPFDTMLRSLSTAPSRRDALRLLAGSVLGLLAASGLSPAQAHNTRQACAGIKNHKKRERCKRRAHAHNAQHAGADQPSPSPDSATRPGAHVPTCTDGITNGSESDVDCGGSCPLCGNTRDCTSQDDCRSALCVSGVCEACSADPDCGIDADGACLCQTHNSAAQQHVCTSRLPGITSTNCDHCPDDMNCIRTGLGDYTCFKPCGAA